MATKQEVVTLAETLRDGLRNRSNDPPFGHHRQTFGLHAVAIGIAGENFEYRPRYGDDSPSYEEPRRQLQQAIAAEKAVTPGDEVAIRAVFRESVEARAAVSAVTLP